MPLFKRREEIVDIPDLQRRGLLKNKIPTTMPQPDYTELPIAPQETEPSNPLGFLDTFAASSTSSEPTTPLTQSSIDPTDIQDLRVKLEDFEYKMDRFTEKVAIIEAKLEEFEKKGL